MASLVPPSFLNDLVMLFCVERCLFKLGLVPSHIHVLFLSSDTPHPCMRWNVYKCAHNLSLLVMDALRAFTGRCFLYAVSSYLFHFLHCTSTEICLLLC